MSGKQISPNVSLSGFYMGLTTMVYACHYDGLNLSPYLSLQKYLDGKVSYYHIFVLFKASHLS